LNPTSMAENAQSSKPAQDNGTSTPGSGSSGDALVTEFKVYKPPTASTTSPPRRLLYFETPPHY
jgi:tether containing UBX domain for GLUT4